MYAIERTHPPFLIRPDIQRGKVFRTSGVLAISTCIRRRGVCQIALARVLNKVSSILSACLPWRRVEERSFAGRTADGLLGQDSCKHAANPICGRIDIVHPVSPEDWQARVGAHDPVEERDHDEKEGQDLISEM